MDRNTVLLLLATPRPDATFVQWHEYIPSADLVCDLVLNAVVRNLAREHHIISKKYLEMYKLANDVRDERERCSRKGITNLFRSMNNFYMVPHHHLDAHTCSWTSGIDRMLHENVVKTRRTFVKYSKLTPAAPFSVRCRSFVVALIIRWVRITPVHVGKMQSKTNYLVFKTFT